MNKLPWGRLIVIFIIALSFTFQFTTIPIESIVLALVLTAIFHYATKVIIGTGAGLLIFLAALFFTNYFLTDKVVAVGVAVIIASIPYFRFVFPYVTCFVPADRAWVLSNQFMKESAQIQDQYSGYRKIIAQREVQAGFHWKLPWEKPDKQIDMTRLITIENDLNEVYTLQDKSVIIIHWRVFYGPLPGNIVNYIRTRPDHIKQRIKDRANAFIQGYVGDCEILTFGKEQQEIFKVEFEKIYGGPNVIDGEERELGVWTGTPQIIAIDQPRTAQEVGNLLNKVIEAVKNSGGKMTVEDARGILLASNASGVQFDHVEFAKLRK